MLLRGWCGSSFGGYEDDDDDCRQVEHMKETRVLRNFSQMRCNKSIKEWMLMFHLIVSATTTTALATVPAAVVPSWAKDNTFLVKGSNCEILHVDPRHSPVTQYFKPLQPTRCSEHPPLTALVYNQNRTRATLVVFRHRLRFLAQTDDGQVQCKYQSIKIAGEDNKLIYSEPRMIEGFSEYMDPSIGFVYAECKDSSTKKVIYKNVHEIMLRDAPKVKAKLSRRINDSPPSTGVPKLGIIMLQIDSLSWAAFNRTMPKSLSYLAQTGWFPLMGHHKVEANTMPNMNVILGGRYSQRQFEKRVWRDFHRNGYVTAYAEDGNGDSLEYFPNRTDFESLTMKMALADLPPKYLFSYKVCDGPFPVFERVYDQMIDFATTFRGEQYLGLFVSTAQTHNDVSGGSTLEFSMQKYLKMLDRLGIRNDSIIILYGDHGLRFGPHRWTFESNREDAMPMLMFSLPGWFQQKHPEIVSALRQNRNRLTSHYDLHLTLKHIIELNGGTPLYRQLSACANCMSLFERVPEFRTCSDAGIPRNYCFCNAHKSDNSMKRRKLERRAVEKMVKFMNKHLDKNHPKKCWRITNPIVSHSRLIDNLLTVVFHTNLPNRHFESSIEIVNGDVSNLRILFRPIILERYSTKNCAGINMYCYCPST